jgi:hypothetical protein
VPGPTGNCAGKLTPSQEGLVRESLPPGRRLGRRRAALWGRSRNAPFRVGVRIGFAVTSRAGGEAGPVPGAEIRDVQQEASAHPGHDRASLYET